MIDFTIVVTIGRNIGDTPMEPTKWALFINSVKRTLQTHGLDIIQMPAHSERCQQGYWEGSGCEDAATFVCLASIEVDRLARLKEDLYLLKEDYEQEAIGYIVAFGHNNLIS